MLDRAHSFLLVGLSVFLCAQPVGADWDHPVRAADLVSEDVASEETTQRLELPPGLPEQFDVVVRIDAATHVLHLVRHTLRAPGFRSHAYLADGRTIEVVPDRPATYRGWVVDQPLWPVVADLRPEGLNARIFFATGSTWKIRTVSGEDRSSGGALHTIGSEPRRSTTPFPEESPHEVSAVGATAGTEVGTTAFRHDGQHVAEIAFDLHNSFYVENGSTIPGAVATAEAILNEVDFFFAQEALITYAITEIIVRTTPFYAPSPSMSQLRAEWNTNQAHIPRDLAHLLFVWATPSGVADTGVICDLTRAYGISSHGAEVMGHELAHNWGADHCHEYWPCNATCDSCLSLGLKTRSLIMAFRDTLTCLDEAGGHPMPLPPFALADVVDVTRDELAAGATRAFDVLANDHDGNLDPLSIEDFDPVGRQGGTVVLSEGTGGGGHDELIYTTPESLIAGDDFFHYYAGDGTGLQTRGGAKLRVAAPGLAGYWPLDGTADDVSGGRRNGSVGVAAEWTSGVYGEALQFDGVDDYVNVPGLGEETPAVTFAAWLRRDGDQVDLAGVIVARGVNPWAGLNFGTANELRYHWNDDPAASEWDSGLVVPDGQWVLVALAVETDQATIYLHDGATLHSSVNPVAHAVLDFDGPFYFGKYVQADSRYFAGRLDDVRIYNHALGPAEIIALHDLGGKAFAPNPPDSGRMLLRTRELSWSAGPGAQSHDVYFGADYAAVRDATTASPEFLGNTVSTEALAPPPLLEGATYAWRVDEVTAGGTIQGDVWLFSVGSWFLRWPLDELSGTTAGNMGGGFDGTYLGSPRLARSGAQPELGYSVFLDGIDDAIELPPLNLHRNELSFTLWVRRNGFQTRDAGLFVTRTEATIAGLNVDPGGGLRYKWNDRGTIFETTFSSAGAVLPDGEWALVALAIAPDKTTIHIGEQGVVQRTDIFTPNGPEEFDGPLFLGQDPIGELHFRGWLDDFRIHDHALSPAEVAALYAEGIAAGRVPDGAEQPGSPLLLDKLGGEVLLSWSPSCLETDSDFVVYEGEIGDFDSHLPATCTAGGAQSTTVSAQPGGRYFLVVPASVNREGSYGTNSEGQPRPPSAGACFARFVVECP